MKTVSCSLLLVAGLASHARGDIFLGSAAAFGVLAGSTVTNTGASVIQGNLGVSPGTAITGFPPGVVTGTIDSNNAAASAAKSDLIIGYGLLGGPPANTNLSGIDLGGLDLTAGVYSFDAAADLTGDLTLSGGGNFIFRIGSALNVANDSSISTVGGANPFNIYFQVGSSATVGTNDDLEGNIIAMQSISLGDGSSIMGRALAIDGAVTLDNNAILMNPMPEPNSIALCGVIMSILAGLSFAHMRKTRHAVTAPPERR